MPDYEVIWDGSKAFNRGYLNVNAEETKVAPAFRINTELYREPVQSVMKRISLVLRHQSSTVAQLRAQLRRSESAIMSALVELRKTGTLRSRKLNGPDHGTTLLYWIDP